jgi:hypothetical protein
LLSICGIRSGTQRARYLTLNCQRLQDDPDN